MKDPVCGMDVTEPPKIQMQWENKVYGFCNPGCLKKFQSDPQKYLNSVPSGQMEESGIKTFLPLIIIFSAVFVFSAGPEIYDASFNLQRWMQNFMAAFFIIFSGMKLINWRGFVDAYRTYDVLAKKSAVYAYAYPLIELSLGTAYLFKWNPLLTNLITAVVMAVSSVGVAQALSKKQKIQCACLGAVFKIPMTKVTLLEDLLMGGMALFMLAAGH